MRATPEDSAAEAKALDLLMPLQFFYLRDDWVLPEVEFMNGVELPDPYQGLLVHGADMTSTLSEFHESEISLEVLDREVSDGYVMRSVVLRSSDGVPVEFGAIGIQLEGFDELLKVEVETGAGPLGGLLQKHRFPYTSRPKGYFRVKADQFMANHLSCSPGAVLYGRCNELLDAEGLTFADIVEILPLNS